jgi:hypothetical protein
MPVAYYVRENKLTTPPSYSCQTSADDAPFNNEYTLSVSPPDYPSGQQYQQQDSQQNRVCRVSPLPWPAAFCLTERRISCTVNFFPHACGQW